MSYDSRALELLGTRFLQGDIKKEDLEQMISLAKCEGTDYIVDSPNASETKTSSPSSYRIEDQGDKFVMIKDNEKSVAVLEYFLDSPGILYLPWVKSEEEGKGHMSKLFSRAKEMAKSRRVETILCEIDSVNKKMQDIASHWDFKQGGRVKNSANTNSFYYFYDVE